MDLHCDYNIHSPYTKRVFPYNIIVAADAAVPYHNIAQTIDELS